MPINGPIGRGFVVKNRGAKPAKIGTSDDEEENDGDEAREIEDSGLAGCGREYVCQGVDACVCGKGVGGRDSLRFLRKMSSAADTQRAVNDGPKLNPEKERETYHDEKMTRRDAEAEVGRFCQKAAAPERRTMTASMKGKCLLSLVLGVCPCAVCAVRG